MRESGRTEGEAGGGGLGDVQMSCGGGEGVGLGTDSLLRGRVWPGEQRVLALGLGADLVHVVHVLNEQRLQLGALDRAQQDHRA